jgi:hypothetical protein
VSLLSADDLDRLIIALLVRDPLGESERRALILERVAHRAARLREWLTMTR